MNVFEAILSAAPPGTAEILVPPDRRRTGGLPQLAPYLRFVYSEGRGSLLASVGLGNFTHRGRVPEPAAAVLSGGI